jgi:hypothetical protein
MDLSEHDRLRAARAQRIRDNIERLEARFATSKDEKTRARLAERIRIEQGRLGNV